MRILHCLSQRPERTGSGVTVQAFLEQAARAGHENGLVAGIPVGDDPVTPAVSTDHRWFVTFGEGGDLDFPVAGMSDVMPYDSTRFRDFDPDRVERYEHAFESVLRRAIDGFRPDLIHSHHLWLLSALVRRLFPDIPQVVSCHGSDLRQFRNVPDLAERVRGTLSRSSAVLALSRIQRDDILELHDVDAGRVHVVGSGTDPSRFAPSDKPAGGPVRLVYAGKLSRAKGVVPMLRALAGIDGIDWHLDLIGGGSGAESEEIHRVAADVGERITVHGYVDQEVLVELYGRAHVFVLPSLYEGLPLVVLEALASGCRLVSTALPGVVEIFEDRTGDAVSLVPLPYLHHVDEIVPGAEEDFVSDLREALVGQCRKALERPEIDLDSYRPLIDRFSWPAVFSRVDEVYRKVIGS